MCVITDIFKLLCTVDHLFFNSTLKPHGCCNQLF